MNKQKKLFAVIRLLRPYQWTKNAFVLIPLLFSESFFDLEKVVSAVYAFVLFNFLSSSVYVLNDILDIQNDRLHPRKKHRPLAIGIISPISAWIIFSILIFLVFLSGYFLLGPYFLSLMLIYLIINVAYTIWLKYIVLFDMFTVASGYPLRVIAGAFSIGVFVSSWIMITSFFLSLFIISSKRYRESLMHVSAQRDILKYYTSPFLKELMTITLTTTITVYLIYLTEVRNDLFLLTIIPVMYGISRFLWLINGGGRNSISTSTVSNISDDPALLVVKDYPLQLAVVSFVIIVVLIFTLLK